MDVVIGLVILSLALVGLGLIFFFVRLRDGDFDHGERLSLLPLREDRPAAASDDDASREEVSDNPKEGGGSNGSR